MFDKAYREVKSCRVCHSTKLTPFWSMGECNVVEFPFAGTKPEKPLVPLTLCVCEDCWLVQLAHTTNPKYLYQEFFYRSGTNEMMRAELKDIAFAAASEAQPEKNDYVLDIGCNDGTLLESYPAFVAKKVGMDPARNIFDSRKPWQKDWKFVCDYFSAESALKGSFGRQYKIITAIAMFYDLDDPVDFVRQVRAVLHDDGVFVVQMNYLGTMLAANGVDNVCHEHLTYFSLGSFFNVVEAAGLEIFKVEVNATNGGSLRAFISHMGRRQVDRSVRDLMMKEITEGGLQSLRPYGIFNENVQKITHKLDDWIEDIVQSDKRVYAYGASTRGATLMQLLQKSKSIVAAAERDPNKIGRYMAGTNTPILPENVCREEADYFLVLPWHFLQAIRKREEEWMLAGGKLIVPFPWPRTFSLSRFGKSGGVMELIDAVGVNA